VDEKDRYQLGIQTRRATLGDAYVDVAISRTTPMTKDFQDLVNRYVWGEIWSRKQLDTVTRRLVTLTMLIALNRGEEFELHTKIALEQGVEAEKIKEIILQSAIYCGIPAANTAFRQFEKILASGKNSE
jgi:4-carboxymuconolactone decarboxylase